MWLIVMVLFLVCVDIIKGADIPTPRDAIQWAIVDQIQLDQQYGSQLAGRYRYVWIPPWSDEHWIPAVNFALNAVASQSSIIYHATPIANGWMLRVDLKQLAPYPNAKGQFTDLRNLIDVWDALASDEPYFHIPAVNTGIKDLIIASPTFEPGHAELLESFTISPSLVYRADWLLNRMLTNTRGGRYYEFIRAVVRSSTDRRTDAELFLARHGVFEDLSLQFRADQRVGILFSRATGKPRQVEAIRGIGSRQGTGQAWITKDISDEQIDAQNDPLENLSRFTPFAQEFIVEARNGMQHFYLANGRGQQVRSVPENVAIDHTIDAPHTARLEPALSCIACHGDNDGLNPTPNDVQTLLSGSRADIFDDFGARGAVRDDVDDRLANLAGQYAGNFDNRLLMGRASYREAVRRSTQTGPQSIGLSVGKISQKVVGICRGYSLARVTPRQALLELGIQSDDETAAGRVVEAFPAPQVQSGVVYRELPQLLFLRAGMSISRVQFERAYNDLLLRVK